MNKKLEDMKEDYMNIKASDELRLRVSETINEYNNKTVKKRSAAGIAAGVAIALVATLNLNESFASTLSEVPGMSGIVKVLTLGKYSFKDGGYEINIVTPRIEGLLDKELEDKINQDFKENADSVIAAFEEDVRALKEKYPGENVHFGMDSGYLIKTDNDDYLAIDVYLVNTVGSSSTIHKFYTIDKKNGTVVTLESLFKPDADYVEVLNKYLLEEMKRQNEIEPDTYWIDHESMSSFESIRKDQGFYINSDGKIVICFDKYEIAPGYIGSPEFVIPDEVIKDIINHNYRLSR